MDFILYWLMAFLPIVLFKVLYVRYKKIRKNKDSMVFTEAIGLPLTFLQPVVFFKSVLMFDWLGALITVWWGPGFLTVVFLVLWSKFKKRKINWGNSRNLYFVAVQALLSCLCWTGLCLGNAKTYFCFECLDCERSDRKVICILRCRSHSSNLS